MNEYLYNNSTGLFGNNLNENINEIVNTSNYIYNTSNHLATDINNTSNWVNFLTICDIGIGTNKFSKSSLDHNVVNIDSGVNVGIGTNIKSFCGNSTDSSLLINGQVFLTDPGYTGYKKVWGALEPNEIRPSTLILSDTPYLATAQNKDGLFRNVKGESDVPGIDNYATFTYDNAVSILETYGARFRTLEEIMAGVGSTSRQQYDAEYIWTSTTAGHNKKWVCIGGFKNNNIAAKIVDITDPLEKYRTRAFWDISKANLSVHYDDNSRIRTKEVRAEHTVGLKLYTQDDTGILINDDGDINITGAATATSFIGDGSQLTLINLEDKTTDHLTEGVDNLYHTEQRVLDIIKPFTDGLTDHTDDFDILKNEITEYVGDVYEFKVNANPNDIKSFLPYPAIDAVQLDETNKVTGDGINIVKDLYIDWDNEGDVKNISLKSFIHYIHGVEKWNYDMHGFNNLVTIIHGGVALANLKKSITAFQKKLKQELNH